MTHALELTVNGTTHVHEVEPRLLLVHFLRDVLGLTGTHIGCDTSQCGACTVLVDGKPVDACLFATAALDGRQVRTIEGLSRGGPLGLLQQAFVDHGAVQCGFCTPGFLMTLTALLEENPSPPPSDVKEALAGNICRCTGYRQMIDAVAAVIAHGERP